MQLKIGAACIVRNASGAVLLVKREDLRVWTVPGGAAESGEAPAEAAIRETVEESGIHPELGDLVGAYTSRGADFLMLIYIGRAAGGTLTRSFESVDVRYFPPNALPERMLPTASQWLVDGLGGARGVLRYQPLPLWMRAGVRVFLPLRKLRNALTGHPEAPIARREVVLHGTLNGKTITVREQPHHSEPPWDVLLRAAAHASGTRVTAERLQHVASDGDALALHIALREL